MKDKKRMSPSEGRFVLVALVTATASVCGDSPTSRVCQAAVNVFTQMIRVDICTWQEDSDGWACEVW